MVITRKHKKSVPIPLDANGDRKLTLRGDITLNPEISIDKVSYVPDELFSTDLENIFSEYDDVFKTLISKN